tara:strand:- start:5903 stop:6187 length:285 start_codon:yes stop_codon:yes gene_type:complete
MTNLKVTKVRYFETRRGCGYECTTNQEGVKIWNDGDGGSTYIETRTPIRENTSLYNLSELELENLINEFEGIPSKKYESILTQDEKETWSEITK